jgi:hypothetical protein
MLGNGGGYGVEGIARWWVRMSEKREWDVVAAVLYLWGCMISPALPVPFGSDGPPMPNLPKFAFSSCL